MSSSSRSRQGFTLVEVVICLTIFVLLLGPVVGAMSTASRMGFSSHRLLEATTQAQALAEAISELEYRDLPALGGGEVVLLEDGQPLATTGSLAWQEVAAFFEARPEYEVTRYPDPGGEVDVEQYPMHRVVVGEAIPDGPVVLKVRVSWLDVPGREETRRDLELATVLTPSPLEHPPTN